MNILEALTWAEKQIKETEHEKVFGGHNAKLDAQVLLSHCLKKPTSYLFSHIDENLSPQIQEQFQRFVERRSRHEPVAYILGDKEFYGRRFTVNPFVLIPRPETEMMVDEVKRRATEQSSMIDIGTGSGAIGVTNAAETGLPVVAIDIDPNALAVARHNAALHNVDTRMSFHQGSLLEPYLSTNIDASNEPHMIITANLPYLRLGTLQTLDPDVKDYEPKHALVAGVDGLDLYDAMLQQLFDNRQRFPAKVDLLMEIDPSQELTLPRLVQDYFPAAHVEVLQDHSGQSRLVIAQL